VETMSTFISPILALVGTLGGALGGTWLGAHLQRKASEDAQRSLRLERTVEQKTQPITDYLHHASIVLGSQPHIHDVGGRENLPDSMRAVYDDSLTSMFRVQGPANVRVSMLGDEELTAKIRKANALMRDLGLAMQEEREINNLVDLWNSCGVAVANATASLEAVQERLIEGTSPPSAR
jgi:hypothetical protein